MSDSTAPTVSEGDTVLLFESFQSINVVQVIRGKVWTGRLGKFTLSRLIGLPFGSVLWAEAGAGRGRKDRGNGKLGWVTVLKPSPPLWTLALSHRTQILYSADISLILLQLRIRPGSVVVESGTGSGSLTTSFADTVSPGGRVRTFEFNSSRVEAAIEDFKTLGIQDTVSVTHRDALADGFGPENNYADAVFLDLPAPWDAIAHASAALKPNARLCSFSPCIEQIQRTASRLSQLGFSEVKTFEVLNRTYDTRNFHCKTPNFGSIDQTIESESCTEPPLKKAKVKSAGIKKKKRNARDGEPFVFGSRPFDVMKGHTGYLIFATSPVV